MKLRMNETSVEKSLYCARTKSKVAVTKCPEGAKLTFTREVECLGTERAELIVENDIDAGAIEYALRKLKESTSHNEVHILTGADRVKVSRDVMGEPFEELIVFEFASGDPKAEDWDLEWTGIHIDYDSNTLLATYIKECLPR